MKRILFVDDEPNIHAAAERAFHDSDFHLIHACDGKEALEFFLKKKNVDAIVTDIYMENDGFQLIQNIRSHDPEIPIIVISGGDRDGDIYMLNACKEIGGNVVLEKPVPCKLLLGILKKMLN